MSAVLVGESEIYDPSKINPCSRPTRLRQVHLRPYRLRDTPSSGKCYQKSRKRVLSIGCRIP